MDPTVAELPSDLLSLTLSECPAETLCCASLVSHHWRQSATPCWPGKLLETFSLAAPSAGAARRSFAYEANWARKKYTYAPKHLPSDSDITALLVDAESASACIATVGGSCPVSYTHLTLPTILLV